MSTPHMTPLPFSPVDLVIPAAPKDCNKLPYLIKSVRQHIEIETIHVITPEPGRITQTWPRVRVHADADVLPYDPGELPYRPNWIFQQILKVFQDITEHDWFLVMDADIIANNAIPLWTDEGKPIFNLGRNQFITAYFEFTMKMLGCSKVYAWSFLSECVLYSKQLVREMLAFCGLTLDGFWQKCVEVTGIHCHMADAELYGSYIVEEHPNLYDFRHLLTTLGGKYDGHVWSEAEIEAELAHVRERNPDAHLISIHSWAGW